MGDKFVVGLLAGAMIAIFTPMLRKAGVPI